MPRCPVKLLSAPCKYCAVQPTHAPGHQVRPYEFQVLSCKFQSSKSGYKRRAGELARTAMDGFRLTTDNHLPLQGRGMFDGGTDASMFAADDGFAGVASFSSGSDAVRTKDQHKNKGKDLFFCDLPELGGFDDFETNMRNFDPTFEIGNIDFDDTLWSVFSPYAQRVPSSSFDSTNASSVRNPSTTDAQIHSSVPAPDQNNMTHSTNIQEQPRSDGRNHTPWSYDAELFGPFHNDIASAKQTARCEGLEAIIYSDQQMQVPTTSSSMLSDESGVTSSTSSGPDLVAAQIPCSKRKLNDPLHRTPDMLLEGMAENPLEMYFPPLTTLEQPEELTSNNTSTQAHQFPEQYVCSTSVPNHPGMQFCSKEMSSAGLHEQPRSTVILEAVPVKRFGFEKLQNGMNQMDVATKGRMRDALYRLANSVEQRHYAASTSRVVGSSSSNRFISSTWTETWADPMDQSVAQLLLQKPPYRSRPM